jgi:hypothetical protein
MWYKGQFQESIRANEKSLMVFGFAAIASGEGFMILLKT